MRVSLACSTCLLLVLSSAHPTAAQRIETSTSNQATGGERIAWDQNLPATPSWTDYQFLLFVDGTAAVLEGVSCAPATPSTLACSAVLPTLSPGEHVLRMAAALDGRESVLSDSITVGTSASALMASGRQTPSAASAAPAEPICATNGSLCYDATTVASMRERIHAVAAVAGGQRVFFVENGREVRVVEGGQLNPEPAMVMDRPADRLIAIGVDPSFAQTQGVSAAWIDEADARNRMLTVARFRDVNGVWGQRAVVVAALPVRGTVDPIVRWDSGQAVIAMPAPSSGEPGDPYDGAVLRIAADGTAAGVAGNSSPVVARGVDRPAALAIDEAADRIWTARSVGAGSELRWFSPEAPSQTGTFGWAAPVVSMAPGADPTTTFFVADATGVLYALSQLETGTATAISFGGRRIVEVVAGTGGPYVVLRWTDGGSDAFAIVKLTAR